MDNNLNDFEAGTISNVPRNLNKKMRKRKHLDALLKFRSQKNSSNDILRSSEDELFLPHQKPSITRFRSSSYDRCWNYSTQILSFGVVCTFIIICIYLTYVNIQLKNEVQNLSSRINEIEQKFSNIELNNISLTIKQIKTRLNFLEHLNYLLNKTQKIEDNELNSFLNDIQNTKIQELKIQLEQLTNLVHNSSDKNISHSN